MFKVPTFYRKFAIVLGGGLLFGYLALLLMVAYEGQARLSEHQDNELNSRVEGYAQDLDNFFSRSEVELEHLAEDKTIRTFFANKASGMSMEYGLGASLHKVYRQLQSSQRQFVVGKKSVINRLALLDMDGTTISDSERRAEAPLPVPKAALDGQDKGLFTVKSEGSLNIYQFCTLKQNNKPNAVIVADINTNLLVDLLSQHESSQQESLLQLTSHQGSFKAWDSFNRPPRPEDNHLIRRSQAVPGTQLLVQAIFEPVSSTDLFTSRWFVLGIFFLGIPVIYAFFLMLRFNNRNLVLQTEINVSAEQKQRLAQKNRLLQREVQKRLESEKQLAYQATHDTLTALPNRKAGQDALNRAILQAQRSGDQVLLMFIDLDNFKHINDSKGHHHGDQLLVQSAKRLRKALRSTDTVARFGGDEFLIILPNVPDHNAARGLATDLLRTFDQPFIVDHESFYVSTSIGMALYPQDGTDAEDLIQRADVALYRVKEGGRNGFSFYDASMNASLSRRLELDAKLRVAIEQDLLDVHYQPVIDLPSEQIVGAEALVRWKDPELGNVPPDEFIPLAERNGLIHQLGSQVLTKACLQAARWQQIKPLQLAVNVSSVQFRQCEVLIDSVRQALSQSGLQPNRLELEVTESLLLDNHSDLSTTLALFSHHGIELAIDDFGTGYSALSYLHKFPFSKLKIDRAFLKNLDSSMSDKSLVKAILAMARALDLKVVAEGIEQAWHSEFLRQHHCQLGQGYYYSKPLPPGEFERLLVAQTANR